MKRTDLNDPMRLLADRLDSIQATAEAAHTRPTGVIALGAGDITWGGSSVKAMGRSQAEVQAALEAADVTLEENKTRMQELAHELAAKAAVVTWPSAPTNLLHPETGDMLPEGTLWREQDGDAGPIVEEWVLRHGGWEKVTPILDVAKLVVWDGANINDLVAQHIAAAVGEFLTVKVQDLVSNTATIDQAVIRDLASQIVTARVFRSTVNAATGMYSVMDSDGFRVVRSTPDRGDIDVIRMGPSGDQLVQFGEGQNSATIDSSGGINARMGSFQELLVAGRPLSATTWELPRGIVSRGHMYGGFSRKLRARDQVMGVEADLQGGRVYRIRTTNFTVQTENANVCPHAKLHLTLDGSYPGNNWDGTTRAESIVGQYPGFRVLPGMETVVDLRGRDPNAPTLYLRCGVSLADYMNQGWAQVAATVNPLHIYVEDLGTNYVDRGAPWWAGAVAEVPPRVRTVRRWNATGWATYFRSGSRDLSSRNPIQGQWSAANRECFFFFDDIASVIAGSTIYRITLGSFADSWAYGAGGTGRWHWHGMYGSIPDRGQYQSFMVDTGGWPRGAERRIDLIPQEWGEWQSGRRRGFGFSTSSTDIEYYGVFSTDMSRHWVEVDFEK